MSVGEEHLGEATSPDEGGRALGVVRAVCIAAAVLGVTLIALSETVLDHGAGLTNLINTASAISASAGGIALLWPAGPAARSNGYRWFGAALLSWGAGQTAWTIYELRGRQTPFPSLADIGYLAFLPLMAVALVKVTVQGDAPREGRYLSDALLVGAAAMTIVSQTVLGSVLDEGHHGVLAVVISLAYPMGDVMLISLLVAAAAQRRMSSRSILLLAGGLAVFAMADLLFAYRTANGTYQTGGWTDVGWILAPPFIVWSQGARAALPGRRHSPAWLALFPLFVAGFAAVTFLVSAALGRSSNTFALIAGPAAVLVLCARQIEAYFQNRRLVQQILDEHDMRSALFDLSHDPIVIADATGSIRAANPAAVQTFGSSDLVGGSMFDRFIGAGPYAGRPSQAGTHEGNAVPVTALTTDGREVLMESAMHSLRLDDETLALVHLHDVTERVASERAIREREQRYRDLFDNAPDIALIHDRHGRVVEANVAFSTLTGRSPADLVGCEVAALLAEGSREPFARALADLHGTPGTSIEVEVVDADGALAPFELSGHRLGADPDALVEWLGRDLRERRALEAISRAVQEERIRFSAAILRAQESERARISEDVHDDSLQVMAAVQLRLEGLARRTSDPEQLRSIRELADVVTLGVRRLRALLFELRPRALEHDGVVAALRQYGSQMSEDGRLRVVVSGGLDHEPAMETRVTLFRIAQEALSDIARRHPGASVGVHVTSSGVGVSMIMRGPADPDAAVSFRSAQSTTIAERASLAGGSCDVRADADGTEITVWLPDVREAA